MDIDNFFNNDVIMSSLVTNLNSSTAHDYCKLDHDCRRLRSHRRRDSTRQLSRVGVGGVHRALYHANPDDNNDNDDDTRIFASVDRSTDLRTIADRNLRDVNTSGACIMRWFCTPRGRNYVSTASQYTPQ